MEESIENIKRIFEIETQEAEQYSPLVLAYIGDAVYEIIIRILSLSKGNRQVEKMHKYSANLVKANTQAKMGKLLLPEMREDEAAVYKRGRNAHSHTVAKNSTISDYRHATGFEALIGYLYIKGETERVLSLVKTGLESIYSGGIANE